MTTRRMPSTQISPPQPAARVGDPAALWESRIVGNWSHAQYVLNVEPVHRPRPVTGAVWDWGSYVWASNVTTGQTSPPLLVRSPNPHVTIVWGPSLGLNDRDLIQIVGEPHPDSAGLAAVHVNSSILTVSDGPLPAVPTSADPPFVPPAPGFDEAQFDIDVFGS